MRITQSWPDACLPKMPKDKGTAKERIPAAERLTKLSAENQLIPFRVDVPDREYPYVIWSIWGAIPTNELFVRVSNGKVSFVDSAKAGLIYPSMRDRIFGMDLADEQAADELANRMWETHKSDLVLSNQ